MKASEITTKLSVDKRGRGRPRKDAYAPRVPRFISDRREMRRPSTLRSSESRNSAPNDGQTRFLLSFKALPKNLQIIAKTLHPPANNKYEEHRVVCKILNEESNSRPREIFIPTYRKLSQNRNPKIVDKTIKVTVFCFQRK